MASSRREDQACRNQTEWKRKRLANRFSAKGLSSLRKRLGLSAADLGRLIDASSLSIHKWEQGKARPRSKYLAAIASIRSIGKREAEARLQALR